MKHQLSFIFILLCLVCTSVYAEVPTITPFENIYFIQGMSNTYQVEVDGHGDQLIYRLVGAPNGMTINNNGIISYTANLDDQFYLIVDLTVENQNQEQSTLRFVVTTRSALQINNVMIGTSDDDLRQLNNGGSSIPFHPGEEVYLTFQLDNAYTLVNNPYLEHDISPTIESIEYTLSEQVGISFFNDHVSVNQPIRAQGMQQYIVKGRLPVDLQLGNYNIELTATGFDQDVPANEQRDTFTFSLPIRRNPHALMLTPTTPNEVLDRVLTCDETSQIAIPVTFANTGQVDEFVVVTIEDHHGNFLGDLQYPIAVGDETTQTVDVFLPREDDNSVTVYIARIQDQQTIMDKYAFSYSSSACSSLSVDGSSPNSNDLTLRTGSNQGFELLISNPSNTPYQVQWRYNNQLVSNGNTFNLQNVQTGIHTLTVNVIQEDSIVYQKTWDITASNLPLGFDAFTGPATTNPANIINIHSTPLTLENNFGKIVFDANLDLSNIEDLSRVISITSGKVAIDTITAPALNRPATITLYRSYADPKIMVQPGFNNGQLSICNVCVITSNQVNALTFHVPNFSTYVGVENSGIELTINEIVATNIMPGTSGNTTITIINTGAQDLTNIRTTLQNINAKYQARIIQQPPAVLHSGEQATLTLSLFIPLDESDAIHTIGTLQFTSTELSASQLIQVDPTSYIEIQSIKVNSKSNGDLELNSNQIEFKVKNNYPEDMDDVTVTVRILDVNGDDLEEEVDSFKLRTGDDKKVTVDFDLSGETLDEDSYTIEIEIEAEADDNSNHDAATDFTADVDRDRHNVVFTRTDLSISKLSCEMQTALYVTIENKGESDEDDLEIRVSNTNLNIAESKRSIDVDDYSGPDQEYSAIFPLDLTGKNIGTYPIKVELLRDGEVDETQSVTLEITTCSSGTTKAGSITVLGDSNRGDALRNQLDQALIQHQGGSNSQVTASFRDSNVYTLFLGGLVLFVLIAVMLGIAVAIKRK